LASDFSAHLGKASSMLTIQKLSIRLVAMQLRLKSCALSAIVASLIQIDCGAQTEEGFQPIFDGASLDGWETPDMSYWTVEEKAITARITREHPCTINQYLVWKGGELADFELKLKSRVSGEGAINNGFQFRSRLLPDHDICGYQVDNNLETPWLVRLYEEFGRHTLAMPRERATFDTNGIRTVEKLPGSPEDPWFRLQDWHEYHLICIGPRITLRVNSQLVAEVVDNDPRRQAMQGVLGLQLHSGPPTLVQFTDIRLKILKPAQTSTAKPSTPDEERRRALLKQAVAWWPLETGGHGAQPPLRHVPGWEHFELNRRADGIGAKPDARVVLLDGAYFDAEPKLHAGDRATVFLRARDPRGEWNSALFAKRGGHDRVHFNLFSVDLPETPGPDIGFEVRTDKRFVMVSFPVSQVEATAWHDLVGRYDGTNLTLFCDGRLMATKPCRGALVRNEEPLLIGAETEGGKVVHHFRGELEEAAIWSRGLSDDEIRLLSGKYKNQKSP
jgi:hypothetical protein